MKRLDAGQALYLGDFTAQRHPGITVVSFLTPRGGRTGFFWFDNTT
jgi:hypothetical protein